MARCDYLVSKELSDKDVAFSALIMAAMRKADSVNLKKLQAAWPEIWKELESRYSARGGWLPGEIDDEGLVVI